MNQLPYTVDFRNDAVIPYQPQVKSDEFMDFLRMAENRNWASQKTKSQYEEAKLKLSLALKIPLQEQAVRAAEKVIGAFVQDVAIECMRLVMRDDKNLNFYEDLILHLNHQGSKDTEKPSSFTAYTNDLDTRGGRGFSSVPLVSTTHRDKWGLTKNDFMGCINSKFVSKTPIHQYRSDVTLLQATIMAKLVELKVHPQFGSYWVAEEQPPYPSSIDSTLNTEGLRYYEPFYQMKGLFFQVLTYFACLTWDMGSGLRDSM